MKNKVPAGLALLVLLCVIAVAPAALAGRPVWSGGHYPAAMDGKEGIVTGTLGTVFLGTGSAAGAYVAIVSAANVSEEYYNTTSDAKGSFEFAGVNATYSSRLGIGSTAFAGNYTRGMSAYRIYANLGRYGEGYSAPFGIDEDNVSATPVVVHTGPARIELKADKTHVTCDDLDTIRITARVYDTLDDPVTDTYQVNFSIGDGTRNAYNGGFDWSRDNGSFSPSPGCSTFTNTTRDGRASARFGWIPGGFGGNNSTIWAYINGTSIYSAINIYFSGYSGSWTGYVVDQSGMGLEGIPVTLHVMGMNGTTPYELYNMTRTTSSRPYTGMYSFDYIVMNGIAYVYADAETRSADNRTIYGKSGNIPMNKPVISIGTIVLNTASPNATMTSPSVAAVTGPSTTARPTPGFEIAFALAGVPGAAYIFLRRNRSRR